MKMNQLSKRFITMVTICMIALSGCGQDKPAVNQASTPPETSKTQETPVPEVTELPPMAETGTLKISTIYNERYLDATVEKFKELYPNWEVEVKEYGAMTITDMGENSVMSSNDPEAEEKYITELTAELMSGSGPDIISMKQLPLIKLQKANVLEELYGLMDGDEAINIDQFQSNILKAMEYKEKLYVMPMAFQINTLRSLKEIQAERPDDQNWTFDDMIAYFKPIMEAEGIDYVFDMSGQMLFTYLLSNNYDYIVDETNNTCDFTGEQFISILKTCKQLQDDGLVPADGNPSGQGISAILSPYFSSQYISDYKNYENKLWGEQFYRMPNIGDVQGISFTNYFQSYSINANSNKKRAAWEFMKCLVSDEMQVFPDMWGYPINKNVAEQSTKNMLAAMEMELTAEELEAHMADREIFLSEINRVADRNGDIYNIAVEEAKPFFEGELTAEEVAGKIQEKVNIYLSEQS